MIEPNSRAFAKIAHIARSEAGLEIGEAKAGMVHARLRRRVRALGLPDYDAYCAMLEAQDPSGADERRCLVEALTTNVTAFFREEHHFPILVAQMQRFRSAERGRAFRLWSAGCSDGSEPISMILAMRAAFPRLAPKDIEVLATDIDGSSLALAQANSYPISVFPHGEYARYSQMLDAPKAGHFGLSKSWHDRITFRQGNLITEIAGGPTFDVIFCRNVTIYFNTATSAQVHRNLLSALVPGGLICVGHSERIIDPGAAAICGRIGPTAYVKHESGASQCR